MKLLFWWMLCLLVYISIPSHSRQVVKIVYRRRKNHNPTPMPTARPTAIIYDAPDRSNNSHLFSWNDIFQTNSSKELPYSFASGNNDILSVRQLEFDYMNWHSRRYGSDWSFVKHYSESQIHPKSVGEFPSNCWMTPQAIAALCDWALLLPCLYGNINKLPRTIFVHHLMLPHFVDFVLPQIPPKHKFVLVTSGTDQTIPTSSGDIRFGPLRGFAQTKDGGPNWVTLTTHPQILHWFCENHDLSHPKVSTLPVGVIENVYGMTHINISEPLLPVDERPLKFLVAHRMRTGRGPWELRAHIMELCQNQQEEHLPEYRICVSPTWDEVHNDHRKGIPQHQYVAMAQQVPFILCVRGGGLDPSPKAWEALMLGSIPILQHSTLDDAYGQLPVVFVDEWDDLFGNVEKVSERLEELRDLLAPYYNDKALRALVLQRLRMSYWMDIVNATVATGVLPKTTALALDF